MIKAAFRAIFRTSTGRTLELVAAGSTVAICDPTKDTTPILKLDAGGVDELMALLMRGAEHIEAAPINQRALRLVPRSDRSPSEVLRDIRAAGF